jgi:hypothetical protein
MLLLVSQKVSTMSLDDRLQQLHDKATRGMTLSAEEQAQLAAWYAEQDQRESALRGPTGSSQHLAALHAQSRDGPGPTLDGHSVYSRADSPQ